jgi:quinohemoprotein ethanol dehydrogenase
VRTKISWWLGAPAWALLGCALSSAPEPDEIAIRPVDAERIRRADLEPDEWLSHGRDYAEQRYSPLDQIRDDNVADLGLAWAFDFGTRRGLEATSLVVDGVLYTTATWSVVYALDAATGELLWRHDPKVPHSMAGQICCDVVNRGVAVWGGAVYVGTLDGRLIALDARSGEELWSTATTDPHRPYAITGAPRVVKGLVIIGNGGADLGVRGYVSAYGADDGRLVWRFYTVPRDPSQPQESAALVRALETWPADSGPHSPWWVVGGGGTVWDSIAFDPELDLLYVGTGNGAPWSRHVRSPGGGDNLYLSSILALRPETGELVWHYQTTPGDGWDFTATQHMILADLPWEGRVRKVLMQAPKNGFFYVLDRETGELLSAEAFAKVTWASHVDLATGRPVETGAGDYSQHAVSIHPGSMGAHNWHPMAFHPGTGLVYIPAQEVPGYYAPISKPLAFEPGSYGNAGVDFTEATSFPREYESGSLDAWDPVAGRRVWRVSYDSIGNGGVLATGGNLVFQGTADGRFVAYAADSGRKLWEAAAGTGIIATPMTYRVDGVQYVSVLAGWGGAFGLSGGDAALATGARPAGYVLTYRLGGDASRPAVAPAPVRHAAPPPPPPGSEAMVKRGSDLFALNCSVCHGVGGVAGGVIPDLRFMRPGARRAFEGIVLRGSMRTRGMPGYQGILDGRDVDALLLYLADRAHADSSPIDAP